MSEDECEGREKYWSEISDAEKIERIRKEVKRLKKENAQSQEWIRVLLEHEHNTQGRPMSPIPRPYGGGIELHGFEKADDDVYF